MDGWRHVLWMNRIEGEKYPKLNRPEAEFKNQRPICKNKKKIVKYIELYVEIRMEAETINVKHSLCLQA